jgi:hypothetical protein
LAETRVPLLFMAPGALTKPGLLELLATVDDGAELEEDVVEGAEVCEAVEEGAGPVT